MEKRLEDYGKESMEKTCHYCGAALSNGAVCYPHSGGWKVKGFAEKQWLYTVCPGCGYQWALWKLGIHEGDNE